MSTARVDPLTHCMLGHVFRTELVDAVAKSRKARQPLSLLWLDVDECAIANQDHGRERVDDALARVGRTLKRCVGEQGTVARIDVAAFAVLLPGADKEAAHALAQTLRTHAAALQHDGDGTAFRLKLSGAVVQAQAGELPLNLLEAAEELSLRAKQAGRDRLLAR